MQWKLAEKNATMGIWLGKQYLGQKDQIETNNNVQRIQIIDDTDEVDDEPNKD